ncbi:unnamed protein product [Mytilus coruscus]|uniref:Uncharacterized protein n=1 Tax=Mytilus coruscus TaxID=42192 RepID=A0A6J8EE15_MYTCO|nr:unnamed protein product [Mytilus coruscus]
MRNRYDSNGTVTKFIQLCKDLLDSSTSLAFLNDTLDLMDNNKDDAANALISYLQNDTVVQSHNTDYDLCIEEKFSFLDSDITCEEILSEIKSLNHHVKMIDERSAEEIIICLDMLQEEIKNSGKSVARPVTSSWVLRKEKLHDLLFCKMKTGQFQIIDERSAEEIIICLDMLQEEIKNSGKSVARPVTSSWVLRKEKLHDLLSCKMKTGQFQIVLL